MLKVFEQVNERGMLHAVLGILGVLALALGVTGITFGSLWAPQALELFAANEIISLFELVVPFLPVLLFAAGTFLVAVARKQA